MSHETDTPRTDACPHCGKWHDPYRSCVTKYSEIISDLLANYTAMTERARKAEAEVVALAQAIHSRTDPYPEWAICDSVTGIISQINNMVGGVLDRAEKAEAEVERLNDAMNKIQSLASIKANKCLGCAACEEEAHRVLNPTDK